MDNKPLYSYSNEDAINDGIFVDVTPESVKQVGKMQWIVTTQIHKDFSLADIAEMYNKVIAAGDIDNVDYPVATKMNGKEFWMFLEPDNGKIFFKVIYPDEY